MRHPHIHLSNTQSDVYELSPSKFIPLESPPHCEQAVVVPGIHNNDHPPTTTSSISQLASQPAALFIAYGRLRLPPVPVQPASIDFPPLDPFHFNQTNHIMDRTRGALINLPGTLRSGTSCGLMSHDIRRPLYIL